MRRAVLVYSSQDVRGKRVGMSGKKNKGQAKRSNLSGRQSLVKPAARRRFGWWLAGALAVVGAGVILIGVLASKPGTRFPPKQAVESSQAGAPVEQATGKHDALADSTASGDAEWDPAWPPLAASGSPARPVGVVRAAYAYAARRGDVLEYMPCYCGCERQGHRSNKDCFVKGKTVAGVPQWDPMGYT